MKITESRWKISSPDSERTVVVVTDPGHGKVFTQNEGEDYIHMIDTLEKTEVVARNYPKLGKLSKTWAHRYNSV